MRVLNCYIIIISFLISEISNLEVSPTNKNATIENLPSNKTQSHVNNATVDKFPSNKTLSEVDNPTVDICSVKKCIKKCCPKNHHVWFKKRKCQVNSDDVVNITLPVYNSTMGLTGQAFEDVFHLNLTEPAFRNRKFRMKVFEATQFGFNVYMIENGIIYLELPNAYERWLPKNMSQYCLDFHIVEQDNISHAQVGVWVQFDVGGDDGMGEGNYYFTTGMIVSCVFLLLVLLVYAVVPHLRNLGGMVLMAYTASLLLAFLFLMAVQKGGHSTDACVGLTLVVYFSFLASFCWMNTMSYDIWWTFRGYAKARPIHRRGEMFKFIMYCLYAWGVPALMTLGLFILNNLDLKHVPWFITPKIPDKGCFLEGGEKLLYLYVPMLIMIILNWLFFLMTAFNIWRLSRGTAVLDSAAAGNPAAHRKQRYRLLIYLKLSVVMGLNWVLEVVSSFKPELKIWYITDTYNLLIGLAIFLIFVCKKKILKELEERLFPTPSIKSMRSRSRSSSVTETSNISQDSTTIQINPNPKAKNNNNMF